METLNRTIATPINPTALAARSIRRRPGTTHTRRPGGLAGPCGMGAYHQRKTRRQLGFFTALIEGAQLAFQSGLGNLFGGGGAIIRDAHIKAQELAGDSMMEITDAMESIWRQGILTPAYLNQAQVAIDQTVAEFRAFVQECLNQGQCHTSRASVGLREMEAFQKTIIDGWFKPARADIGAGPAPASQAVYSNTQPILPIPTNARPTGPDIFRGIPGLDPYYGQTSSIPVPAFPPSRGGGLLDDLPTWAPYAAGGAALLLLLPKLMKAG